MMSAVENFRRYVNRMIESESEPTTMYGVAFERPVAEEPTTTGRSGRMHGASTVRTPEINEIARNAIPLEIDAGDAAVYLVIVVNSHT
jgi:hypothetical protein